MDVSPATALPSQNEVKSLPLPITSSLGSTLTHDKDIKTGASSAGRGKDTPIQLTDQTNLLPFRQILVVFLGLASCLIISALDSTIVATALPTISAVFNAGAVSSWVPSATLLTSTAFQPLYGRFSE